MSETSEVDRRDSADAKRFRWLLAGNGYLLEEWGLCGHPPVELEEQDLARSVIDDQMKKAQSNG